VRVTCLDNMNLNKKSTKDSRRIQALIKHFTASRNIPSQTIAIHEEGKSPLVPEEETGILLPDGTPRRKLPDIVDGSVNPIAMAKKYSNERAKRMQRHAGNTEENGTASRTLQYPRVADLAKFDARFSKMLADPYMKFQQRVPLKDEVQYIILGAGYGGLTAGARLRERGVLAKNIRIVDKSGDVGGTWYWNRYPGAMCDIEAYVYMPLCDEMDYIPKEKYAHQPEMLYHSQLIAKKYDLYENIVLQTEVKELRWNEQQKRWVIFTDRGDEMKAQFIIVNFGVFSHPKLPAAPGIQNFKGHMFHTSRWDYEYTGGSPSSPLEKLGNKRVAIIGTGATAVQVVPHLGKYSGKLFVFQRTPSTIDVRNNFHTTPEYAARHMGRKGWQKERQMNFIYNTEQPKSNLIDLVNDGWTNAMRRGAAVRRKMGQKETKLSSQERREMMDLSDYEHVERIRKRIEAIVEDKKTAEALKPYYRLFCKRPCFHDDYLPSFNRKNVELVDTNGLGIESFTENGIIANGKEYEVDLIIFATGFETSWTIPQFNDSKLIQRKTEAQGFQIYGRNGLHLGSHWANGPKTFNSFCTHGFPNAFWLNGPQGMITNSATTALDWISTHVSYIVEKMLREGKEICEANKNDEAEYCRRVYNASTASQAFYAACTPGYYSNEGIVPVGTKTYAGTMPKCTPGGGGIPKFRKYLDRLLIEDNCLKGLDIY
jgi:cation diffusion facilitator CzcD-associated flavoprotein CzcO